MPDAPPEELPGPSATARRLPLCEDGLALHASYRTQRFSRHAHERYALGVIEAGALAFRYRGNRLVAPAGAVNLAQPGVPHDGEPAVVAGWRYRMFYLPSTLLSLVLPEGTVPPYFRPGVIEDPLLAARLADTHRLLLDPSASLLARETRLLALLALWIKRHAEARPTAPPAGSEPRAVRLVLELLAARFAEDLGLDDLAREAGLSPWHLSRAVARHTGLSPHVHQREFRLRAARQALAGTDRLADIAAAVGFADQSHLTRVFAARFGLTPGAYRKIVQNF